VKAAGLYNVQFRQADIFALPFAAQSFDHVFVCFVLEHIPRPASALAILRPQLKAGGTITVIEGDHGSAYFHPDSSAAHLAIQCQIELQRRAGGNALIGRQIGDTFGDPLPVDVDGLIDLRDTEDAAAERAQCQDATSRGVAEQPVQIEIARDAGLRDEEGGVRLAPRQGRSEAERGTQTMRRIEERRGQLGGVIEHA